MPIAPALRVVPTDFGHYYSDGTGRDSYIHANNGGLAVLPERFQINLRGATHNPGQVILLPSYGASASTARNLAYTSQAHAAIAAAVRADPRRRAVRKHQKAVAEYLHRAGSRQSNVKPMTAPHYLPQTSRSSAAYSMEKYFPLNSSTNLPPWKPEHSTMTPRTRMNASSRSDSVQSGSATARSYESRASNAAGSQTARELSRGTPAPYATTSFHQAHGHVEQVPFNPMYSRDAFSQSYQFSQPNQPNGFLLLAQQQTNGFHPSPPTNIPSNFSETIPLSQSIPLDASFAGQQFGEEKRERSQQQQPQPQQQQQQQQQPFRPSPPPSFSGTRSMRNPSLVDAKWSPPSPPSFHITLPKNSTYLDASNTYRPLRDYNAFRPAGYSQREKDLMKGIDERQVPLLG
jgi:hypothetical protein